MDYHDEVKRFNRAKDYANEKHEGQVRKVSGERYFLHPLRVAQRVKTIFQMTVAVLHDTIEDTDATYEDIEKKFGKDVADCVEKLTHRKKNESHYDYITRVLTDEDAIAVKIADTCDNLQDFPSQNMIKKAMKSLPRLLKYEGDN